MWYKYRGEKQQVSTDNGRTWTDTGEVRAKGDVIEVYNYECSCEGTCYEITPNVIIESVDGDGVTHLTDRGGGCKTWEVGCYRGMDLVYMITIKDLNTFDFNFKFIYPPQGGVCYRMDIYGLDDVNMESKPIYCTDVTSDSRAVFLDIGGGTHKIPVRIYQKGGGNDALAAAIDFECEYNTNYPTLTDDMPVNGWRKSGYTYSVDAGNGNDLVFSIHNCTRVDFKLTSQYQGQRANYLAVMDIDSDTTVIGTSPRPSHTTADYGISYVTVDNIPLGDHTIRIKNYCGRPLYNTARTIQVIYYT